MISLPARLIVTTYLVRSTAFWVGARGLLTFQQLIAEQDPFGFGMSATAVVVTAVLGLVEIERRHERALLGNLGVRTRDLIPVMVVPSILGETLLQIVLAAAK